MQLVDLVETSRAVGATRKRLEKTERLAALLAGAPPAEAATAVTYLAGELPQGKIGVGYAAVRDAREAASPAAEPSLALADVAAALDRIQAVSGAGSKAERQRLLVELLSAATAEEGAFLARLLIGELRQGALEGVMAEAVARAAEVPPAAVRRAAMLSGDLPAAARAALLEGVAGLERFRLRLFRPVQPMLAAAAEDVEEALGRHERAAFEHKMDGARIQVHRAGDEVRVYSRASNEVTAAVPEVVAAARALPVDEVVLDGEVIALRPDGRPLPFQVTMRRFGRRTDVEAMRAELPLTPFFFDVLAADGADLLDAPATERFRALEELAPDELLVPRIATADPDEARRFLEGALARGHEGVMAKSLEAPYEAGRRGSAWLKIKQAHTLDLVVLAAEWGSGRRRGWLSNLHLGARDAEAGDGVFAMLGKTFKGMTDAMLAWQTEHLLGLELGRDGRVVHVRPELVVEIAFNDVQTSPHYPAGLALRFARVKRYREDKSAAEADTLETVRAIHRAQTGADDD